MLLDDLQLDEQTVADVVRILNLSQTDIQGNRLERIDEGAWGGSPMAAYLGGHTSTAHRHVVEAMQQMVAGLQGYESNVQVFAEDVKRQDEDSEARLRSIEQQTACTAAPTFETNDQCAPPSEGAND